jgi:anti-anti-sigma factor
VSGQAPAHVPAAGVEGVRRAEITTVSGHPAVISVAGHVGHATGWQLRSVIAECLARDVWVLVLDLAALDFCDEAGLHVLTGAAAGVDPVGGAVHL